MKVPVKSTTVRLRTPICRDSEGVCPFGEPCDQPSECTQAELSDASQLGNGIDRQGREIVDQGRQGDNQGPKVGNPCRNPPEDAAAGMSVFWNVD